jgi:hypothetical protein
MDIATLNASFYRMEHLSVEDAHKYLLGKARPAKGVSIFPFSMGPPAKKPRQSLATPRETGRFFIPTRYQKFGGNVYRL